MSNYITIADVREDLLDRKADDHLVLGDLAFTDPDIEWGMKACVRKFHALKPFVYTNLTWETMPINSSVFFDGIAWALIRRWRRNVAMNDLDYSAGGVNAKVQGNLTDNLAKLQAELETEFGRDATDLKVSLNVQEGFGPIG